MDKWEYQNKQCYLENRVVREPCKQRTACNMYPQKWKDPWKVGYHNLLGVSRFLERSFQGKLVEKKKMKFLLVICLSETYAPTVVPTDPGLVSRWGGTESFLLQGKVWIFWEGHKILSGRFFQILCSF